MKRFLTALCALGVLATLGKMIGVPTGPPEPCKKKVAVYGRTLWPTPPPMIVVNKRTSLSGEGVFVMPFPASAAHLK